MPLPIVSRAMKHLNLGQICITEEMSHTWWHIYLNSVDTESDFTPEEIEDLLSKFGLTGQDYDEFMSCGPTFSTLANRPR